MVRKTKIRGKTCWKVKGVATCFKHKRTALAREKNIKKRRLKRRRK